MTTNLNIKKVFDMAEKLGYIVEKEYCIGRECKFLELRSRIYKKPFLLYVPDKYSILHSDRDNKIVKLKIQGRKKTIMSDFQIDEKDDFVKLFVEQQVQNDNEMTQEEYNVMKNYIAKIDRFKECLKSTNYSLAFVAPEGICYLNTVRQYECFICVLSRQNEYGRLLLVSDLTSFYAKKTNLETDLIEMFRGIHEVSHRIRNQQVDKILSANKHLNQEFVQSLAQIKKYQERDEEEIITLTRSSAKIQQAREQLALRKQTIGDGKKGVGLTDTLHKNLDHILEISSLEKEEDKIKQIDLSLASKVDTFNEDIFSLWEISEEFITEYTNQILKLKEIIQKYQGTVTEKTKCLK